MKMEVNSDSQPSTEDDPLKIESKEDFNSQNLDRFSSARCVLDSALVSITKCETILGDAQEDKFLVPVFCYLKNIKDNIGNILEELSKADRKDSPNEPDHFTLEDEYLVKEEISDQDYEESVVNGATFPFDLDQDDAAFADDSNDKDFKPRPRPSSKSSVKVKKVKKEKGAIPVKQKIKKKPSCNKCKEEFESTDEAKSHQLTCDYKKQYKCKCCNMVFDTKCKLGHHKNQEKHFTEEDKVYCHMCDKAYSHKKSYYAHIRESHSQSHKCTICQEAFDNYKELRVHSKEVHNTMNISCGTCKLTFPGYPEVFAHREEAHRETSFTCEVCGQCYSTSQSLRLHVKRKHSLRVKCEDCGEVMDSKMELRKHMAVKHQPSEFVCQTCGFTTQKRKIFIYHLKTHQAGFKCDICGKAFAINYKLKLHMRIHTGDKRYKCEVCGRAFINGHKLKRHGLIHTGELPYTCTVCGKGFNQSSNLNTHMKVHHADVTLAPSCEKIEKDEEEEASNDEKNV